MIDRKWIYPIIILWWFTTSLMAGELTALTPDELKTLQQQGATLIDIRTPEEWQKTGLIPGSKPLTYFDSTGHYDSEDWLKRLNEISPNADGKIILICRSGHRSSMVGRMLINEKGYKRVYHLEKGINEWLKEGNGTSP